MKLSFVGLRSLAQRESIVGIEELIRRTGCCTGCGMCRPYLEEFLKTGRILAGDEFIVVPEYLRPRRPPRPPASGEGDVGRGRDA